MRRTALRRVSDYHFGQTSMGQGFGGIVHRPINSSNIVDSGVKKTVLENGATVITHDKGTAMATVGFFADAGVKYDPLSAPGLTMFTRQGLLSGNMINSMFQIDRAFRSVASSYAHTEVNKRHLGLWAQGNRTTWRVAVKEFAQAFAAPRFAESDLERLRDFNDAQFEETRWQNPREHAVNTLESIAFFREPLGQPRLVPPEFNGKSTTDKCLEKYATYMAPNRVTIVGVNVAHQELISAYSNQDLPHSQNAPHHAKAVKSLTPTSELDQYQGGRSSFFYEDRSAAMKTIPDQLQEGTIALGWLTNGADESAQKFAASLVFEQMLDIAVTEATAQTAVTKTLNTWHGVEAFYRPFSSAGLIGVTIRDKPDKLLGEVEKALKILPTDFANTIAAAKARAVTRFALRHLETESDYAVFLGTSAFSAEEILSAIRNVTVTDVAQVHDLATSKKPTMYGVGDAFAVPTLRKLGVEA